GEIGTIIGLVAVHTGGIARFKRGTDDEGITGYGHSSAKLIVGLSVGSFEIGLLGDLSVRATVRGEGAQKNGPEERIPFHKFQSVKFRSKCWSIRRLSDPAIEKRRKTRYSLTTLNAYAPNALPGRPKA